MYNEYQTRMLGTSFILGPILVVASALIWAFGIRTNPGSLDWGSSLEGAVGFYGYVLLIPVFLCLAAYLGQDKPRWGVAVAILSLFGMAGAIANMTLRTLVAALQEAGASDALFEELSETVSLELFATIFVGPLGPIAAFVLGLGLYRAHRLTLPAWILMVSGPVFIAGQGVQLAGEVLYPLAVTLWAAAFVPLGFRLLRFGSMEDRQGDSTETLPIAAETGGS